MSFLATDMQFRTNGMSLHATGTYVIPTGWARSGRGGWDWLASDSYSVAMNQPSSQPSACTQPGVR